MTTKTNISLKKKAEKVPESKHVQPKEKKEPTHVEEKASKKITLKKAEKEMSFWMGLKLLKDKLSDEVKAINEKMATHELVIKEYVEANPDKFNLEESKTFPLGEGFIKFTASTNPEYPEDWCEADTEALHIEYPHLCELNIKVAVLKAEFRRLDVKEFCGITLKTDHNMKVSDKK